MVQKDCDFIPFRSISKKIQKAESYSLSQEGVSNADLQFYHPVILELFSNLMVKVLVVRVVARFGLKRMILKSFLIILR